MQSAAAPILFRAQVYGIRWCTMWAHRAAAASRRMEKLSSCADGPRWPLLYAQLPPFHCGCASTPQRPLFVSLPSSLRRQERTGPASMPAAASSGVNSGGRAESKGVAHVFDFPTRPRCVDVHVIVSDAVKGSHIQRSPLSMGGLCELGAVAQWRALVIRKISPSSL